ncbi:hypothetical protein QQ045_003773 [Rhodiola kirilowii]
MDRHRRKQARTKQQQIASYSEEVSSKEWEFISMTKQEEDLIHRMYKLVGPRWSLIAGRIPGRKPEEIERFWIMKHTEKGESSGRDTTTTTAATTNDNING